ncbi:MAG: hypothetical protein QXW39_08545 [Candidatus Bathyarchaeia archaeon]
MDMRLIFLISFVISIIVFSYLARKLYQERGTERWMKVSHIILLVLGFLMLLNGFLFEESVMKIFGLASVSAAASLFLMHYIESENRVKRILEAIFSAISLGIITYGYFITRSLILGVTTLFIVVMFLVALILSHFLPKARSHIRLRKNG